MTISPALNGAIKGALGVVLAALAAYFADPSHLTFLNGSIAVIVAMAFSSFESFVKDKSGQGLFGAVNVSTSSS